MSPNQIVEALDAVPFEPFRIVMSSGSAYDVDDPRLLMVSTRYAHLYFPVQPGSRLIERMIRLDTLHITELVPLRQVPKEGAGNGHS
jgi:hypothetical protein